MMMSLGMFVFSLESLAYQQLQRQTDWRHTSTSRIGAPPASQFLGRGEDEITLPGVLFPGLVGSVRSLDKLRDMADTGAAWPMVDGNGYVLGAWVIVSLSETRTEFFRDGTARRYEFTLKLKRVDERRVDQLGSNASGLWGLL